MYLVTTFDRMTHVFCTHVQANGHNPYPKVFDPPNQRPTLTYLLVRSTYLTYLVYQSRATCHIHGRL